MLFDDWTPGFGYKWGETIPTLYFSGCDIGEYKEHISSGIENHITAVESAVRARAAGSEQAIDLPAGLPGATIVARGQGAPPKLTLIGPKGERVTSPDDLRPVQQSPFLVVKDPRGNLTQFAIAKPSAGALACRRRGGLGPGRLARVRQRARAPEHRRARHRPRAAAHARVQREAGRRPAA